MENFVLADREKNENRVIELSNNKAYVRKSGPFGFWAVSLDKGRLPEALQGQYTSPSEAERAVTNYLKSKGRLPSE